MLPGQDFDESRLVKPGEWDSLAGGDENDDAAMAELEQRMNAEMLKIKEEVKAERGRAELKQPVASSKAVAAAAPPASSKATSSAVPALDKPASRLPAGTPMTVIGLRGAPEHNGKHGKVMSFDEESGRYEILLASGESLRIRLPNCEIVDARYRHG